MNKAFVKESDEEPLSTLPEMPTGVRNYITPAGYKQMQVELQDLVESLQLATATDGGASNAEQIVEAPEMQVRELEQRVHYLQTRLELAEIVDPSAHVDEQQIFFGATVTYRIKKSKPNAVTIVGLDEIDPANGKISWLSPVAQALLNAFEGDKVTLETPAGDDDLHILKVLYPPNVELNAVGAGLDKNNVE